MSICHTIPVLIGWVDTVRVFEMLSAEVLQMSSKNLEDCFVLGILIEYISCSKGIRDCPHLPGAGECWAFCGGRGGWDLEPGEAAVDRAGRVAGGWGLVDLESQPIQQRPNL